MRYEAKNKYFKRTASCIGNFKNIEKTVASRHQRYMCYKMTCSTNFLGGNVVIGVGKLHNFQRVSRAMFIQLMIVLLAIVKPILVSDLEYQDALLTTRTDLSPDTKVHRYHYYRFDAYNMSLLEFRLWKSLELGIPKEMLFFVQLMKTCHYSERLLTSFIEELVRVLEKVYELGKSRGEPLLSVEDYLIMQGRTALGQGEEPTALGQDGEEPTALGQDGDESSAVSQDGEAFGLAGRINMQVESVWCENQSPSPSSD